MDLEKLFDKPVLKNLRNAVATVRAIAFLVTAIGGPLVLAYLAFGRQTISLPIAISTGVSILIWAATVLGFWYYIKRVCDPTFYEIPEMNAMLVVEAVGEHHRYVYTKRQTVRATRNNLRLIEFRAHWTARGTKPPTVVALEADQLVLDGQMSEEDGRVHRWIYPFPPLGKGQELSTGLRQVHEDDVQRQRPYFRDGGGRYRTRNLTVTLRFGLDDDPSPSPTGGIWNSSMPVGANNFVGAVEVKRVVDRQARTVDYVVTVERPKRFHSYGMRWSWPPQS